MDNYSIILLVFGAILAAAALFDHFKKKEDGHDSKFKYVLFGIATLCIAFSHPDIREFSLDIAGIIKIETKTDDQMVAEVDKDKKKIFVNKKKMEVSMSPARLKEVNPSLYARLGNLSGVKLVKVPTKGNPKEVKVIRSNGSKATVPTRPQTGGSKNILALIQKKNLKFTRVKSK